MPSPSVLVNISLTILKKSVFVILFLIILFNSPQVLAQVSSSSCPLPQDIAVTFLNSKCREITLKRPRTFYRYYSNSNNKYGRYLTANIYLINLEVIKYLALNQAWFPPNQATMIETVTLPAGTIVYQGIVAPQTPKLCYPGGGQQIFIKDSQDSSIKWSKGQNIYIRPFFCQSHIVKCGKSACH